ncbi:unnamed protein product, partial [Closterium sp. NIES-53]
PILSHHTHCLTTPSRRLVAPACASSGQGKARYVVGGRERACFEFHSITNTRTPLSPQIPHPTSCSQAHRTCTQHQRGCGTQTGACATSLHHHLPCPTLPFPPPASPPTHPPFPRPIAPAHSISGHVVLRRGRVRLHSITISRAPLSHSHPPPPHPPTLPSPGPSRLQTASAGM